MRASKTNVISAKVANMNGVRNGRKKEIKKSKEYSSPNSNSENISPIPKRRRREKESTVEMGLRTSPRTPKGRNGMKDLKLEDESEKDVSPLKMSEMEKEKAKKDAKVATREVNVGATQNDSNAALNDSVATPNSSAIIETNGSNNSDRRLRSNSKKVPSIFDTPIQKRKTVETVETSNFSENDAINATTTLTTEESAQVIEPNVSELVSVPQTNGQKNGDLEITIGSDHFTKDDIEKSTANEENIIPTKDENKLVDQEQPTVSAKDLVQVKEEEILPTSNDNGSLILIDNIKSPSAASVDSAKGSSIATEAEYSLFLTGDLFWGQIHHFCYWPCMVCPDNSDKEQPITRMVERQMEVHVRFFADNARHSWVKRENLLRYLGLKQYKELTNDAKEKYGESSPKCKIFFPKRSKKHVWRSAVKEADDMVNVAYEDRLKTFFKVNDIARERIKVERLSKKSLSLGKSYPDLSLISLMDNSDASEGVKKRNRSESPPSPEYSPGRNVTKRRKTTAADRSEYLISKGIQLEEVNKRPRSSESNVQKLQQQHDALFVSTEFESFYDILKEYITRGFQCDPIIEAGIYRSARNVWAMKQLVDGKIAESGDTFAQMPNGHERKRLSIRLKDLKQRQQMQMMFAASPSPVKSPLQVTYPVIPNRRLSISSKPKNRPIQEVIDDIFNLDKFYLFDNVGGRAPVCKYCYKPNGVLKRCTKGCFSWLHVDCSVVGKVDKSKVGNLKRFKRKSSLNSTELTNSVHVTADDEATESDEAIQKSPSSSSAEVNEDKSMVVDLETSESVDDAIVCKECENDEKPQCFVCKSEKMVKSKNSIAETFSEAETSENDFVKEDLHMCNMQNCGRAYHLSCLKYWPQAKIAQGKNADVSLRCPSHICHTCISDDPKGKFQHLKDANTTKCVKCPATYHMDSTCIPAGSQVLTAAHIICPRHGTAKSDQHVNVSWCFICVRGGKLLCCETCPTAVHAECTNVQFDANDNYICDECESGRMPLYGEMVWAKFNLYRWWPAIILPPTEVPLNIRNKPHNPFDFVIRFFGTHDHGWISRRRVYLYVEGDWSDPPKSKRPIDQSYLRGVIEARETYEIIKAKTLIRDTENENKEQLHPHPYVKIRVNRAIPPVKLHQDIEMANKCSCDPNKENPCGPDSNCLNRVLYHECNPKVCSAGERCQNRMFESRISPPLQVFYAKKERGFGLRCREAISSGSFIIEYVGEVINSEEFQRRMELKSSNRDENYYFLHVEKDYIIDAGPKGNMARFMNHSCDPNCETQKWSVNGLNRVGLFAIKDIPANSELTFNYHWDELLGNDKKVCCCGSSNCTGQIGKITKEEIKRKQEIEAADLAVSAQHVKVNKLEKRRSSLQKKNKGNKIKLSPLTKKRRSSTKQKKRSVVAPPTATENEKITEPNDNNNNV